MVKKKTRLKKTHKKVKTTPAIKAAIAKAKETRQKTRPKKPTSSYQGKIGRPTILTPSLVEKVSSLILAGAYIETACAACGFAKQLYHEWLKLGAQRRILRDQFRNEQVVEKKDELDKKIKMIDPIYEQFNDSIEKAVVEAELRDLLRVDEAAIKSWQAAAWKLERKYPQRWAKQYNVDHSGEIKTGGPTIEETRLKILQIMKDPESLELAKQLSERISNDRD